MSQHYPKLYILNYAYDVPYKYFAVYDHEKRETENVIFMSGKRLPKSDVGRLRYSQDPSTYDLIYSVNAERQELFKYDYLPSSPAPIVNKKALDVLLELCPNDFQFFPVIIESGSKVKTPFMIKNDYWLININKLVDAIDLESSQLTFSHENEIEDIRHIILEEQSLSSEKIHLARERSYRGLMLASPELKDAFVKHKIKGCQFLTDEQYNQISF